MEKKTVKKPTVRKTARKKAEGVKARPKAEVEAVPEVAKQPVAKVALSKSFYAVGRRKTAVAQVLVSGGSGTITVNELPFERYFGTEYLRKIAEQPLTATGLTKNLNIRGKIHGGGIHAQAESLRHAIARGIVAMDPETRRTLKKHGFLTRDSRVKERKKPGLKRARRAPQFSKR